MTPTIKVNGTTHRVDADGDTGVLWVLRDVLGMMGTEFGCGAGLCGARGNYPLEGMSRTLENNA